MVTSAPTPVGFTSQIASVNGLHIPANAPHSFTNSSKGNVRLLCLCAPAGQEEFFITIGDAVNSRTAPPPKLSNDEIAERQKKAAGLLAKYRTEMVEPGS